MPYPQHLQLLLKSSLSQEKVTTGTKESNGQGEQKTQQAQHEV